MPDIDVVLDNMERRREMREKNKGPGKLIKLGILLALLVILLIISYSKAFEVKSIEVSGNKYYSDEEIMTIAHAKTGVNIIHSCNRKQMKKYLEDDPYIESAKVVKSYPDKLSIEVEELRQVGAIVYDDEYLVIDNEGKLLRRTKTKPKITIVTGIRVSKIELGEHLESPEPLMLSNALDIINAMERGDIYFIEINMDEMYVRAHVYDALVVAGTTDEIVDSIEQNRLQQILETLFERGIKRGTIKVSGDGFASFNPSV